VILIKLTEKFRIFNQITFERSASLYVNKKVV